MSEPSKSRGKGEHPWVQVIVVVKTGTHEATVAAAAQASVGVALGTRHDEAFQAWLAGPFTKTVRRASRSHMDQVQAWADDNNVDYCAIDVNGSRALALPPMRYDELPKVVAKLQVSGTDFAHAPLSPELGNTIVVLDSLTTGKAAAQAAHAMWKWSLEAGLANLNVEALRAQVARAPHEDLAHFAHTYERYAVYDNGLTEVEPQTLTAVVLA